MRETPLRKIPQQIRGQQRIHKILNAAEQIFATTGYDNATTNAIAAYADTSIGSLYQFFPNKEAILKAVILRYLEEMHAIFEDTLTQKAAETLTLAEFLDRLINALVQLHESHAGFHPLFQARQSSPEAIEARAALEKESMSRIETLLAFHAPNMSPGQRHTCSRTCITIFQSLMSLAMGLSGEERALQLQELRTVLLSYLKTCI